jgi:hypothetical protein
MFWVFGTLGRFFIFISNEAYVIPDEGLLKWSPRPSGWRSFVLGVWHSWSFLHFCLKWNLRPSRWRDFETKPTSFRGKVFSIRRLRPFGWRLSPMFWAHGTLVHFFVFIWNEAYVLPNEGLLKWSTHPSGWRSFEMNAMSFWMKALCFWRLTLLVVSSFSFETKHTPFPTKVFWNEACVLPDEDLLKWSQRPFRRRSFETKATSFRTKAKPYVLGVWHSWPFLCFHLKQSLCPSRRRIF